MPTLTLKQALLIVDAVNGLYFAGRQAKAHLLAPEVATVIAMGAPEVWVSDGRALLRMIETWTIDQRLSVIDAAELFWSLPAGGYQEGLRMAGLLPTKPAPAQPL
ncbi:hypothetical protein ACIBHX_28630 [Nonomuraea sp. NPDC050536]|uniref:hypothetical protein n=1 Tax=Nonomuraea sp. NPDC050536 TaxID=3364366 RepID=UPI0037C66BE2